METQQNTKASTGHGYVANWTVLPLSAAIKQRSQAGHNMIILGVSFEDILTWFFSLLCHNQYYTCFVQTITYEHENNYYNCMYIYCQ